MRPYLLIDFGSTYTKITAVDIDAPRIIGQASALTTVDDGLLQGYQQALQAMERMSGRIDYHKKLACSSAAGGLKIVAVGLVPELTGEAAKRAALGAGARVIKTYGFQLTPSEIRELEAMRPDLILLTGGTDGGNRETILHNAERLTTFASDIPVIIAGNKSAVPDVETTLRNAGKTTYTAPNVLPDLNRLNIEPVQKIIRELFYGRIIQAKGLDRVTQAIDGIVMPTPAASLAAAVCLADGAPGLRGLGDLIVIDVGGATTDVHSVAEGRPSNPRACWRGLPETRVKRTVEGDLGMRYSAPAILETFSAEAIAQLAGLSPETVQTGIEKRAANVSTIPNDPDDLRLEEVLGYLAIDTAVARHAGRLEQVYTPTGLSYIQIGKDLTGVKTVIGTGGVLVNSVRADALLKGALYDPTRPGILKPIEPRRYIDRHYLLPTLGLIAAEHPETVFRLLRDCLEDAAPKEIS